MSRIFSGIQPTGDLQLGNYLGALKNWVILQDKFESIYCVVDLHGITVWQTPDELTSNTREVTAGLIAAGLDPNKNIIFNQSRVSAHSELAWVFNCVARLGWLNRMTQFKEKAGKDRERASVGLYSYPTLMAADILLYKATHVPVGEDQKQHLELTRDIAQKFNNDFGVSLFPLPEPLILGEAPRVMSLRDGKKKMSKSDPSEGSRINIRDTEEEISKKIKKAKTDAEAIPSSIDGLEERPEASNLIGIYAALSDKSVDQVCQEFGGKQFSIFKKDLIDLTISTLIPIGLEMDRLMSDTVYLDRVLFNGSERARKIAAPTLDEVYDVVGFVKSKTM